MNGKYTDFTTMCRGLKFTKNLNMDSKRFSRKAIVVAIKENSKESRKDWLLDQFKLAAAISSNVKDYQLWRYDNKPIEKWSYKVIAEKIGYVYKNPVEEGLVFIAEDYM